MVLLLTPNPAESWKLQLQTSWPGQYDSETGAPPVNGFPLPTCSQSAEPTLAVSNMTANVGGAEDIQMGADWNFGNFERNGQSDFARQLSLGMYFTGLVPNADNESIESPSLVFDQEAGRYVLVAAVRNFTGTGPLQSWIVIGASALGDVASSENIDNCLYRIDANIEPGAGPTNFFPEHVRLGTTADSIVVAANMYDYTAGHPQYSKLWTVRKADIYNNPKPGAPVCPATSPTPPTAIVSGLQMPDGKSVAFDVAPAKSYDPNSSITYLASAWGVSGSELALWTLDTQNLTLSPGLAGTSVPTVAYAQPPAAAQQGTTTLISTDAALGNAVYQPRTGLWTTHAVACSDASRSCFKWYQIDPQAGKTVQDSRFGYTNSSVYAPSVAVNSRGDAVFAFNESGPNFYVGVNYIGRDAIDPINSLQSPGFNLIAGVSPYDRQGFPPGRKTAADTDPANDSQFWVTGAYSSGVPLGLDRMPLPCKSSNQVLDNWSTQVGAVSFSEPPGTRYDFNGDGYADILLQNDSGEVAIWYLYGLSAIKSADLGNPGSSWHIKGSGDFNGDGFADILWQNDSGEAYIWEINGSTVIASASLGNPGPSWHIKATGDFNGDGFSDILWQNDSGEVAIWEMNGLKPIASASLGNPGPSWHIKATGDFNGDGFADILWQNDSGEAYIWEMNSFKVIASASLGNPGSSWHLKATGDFNGDGYSDILWQNDSGEVVIWEMNGLTPIASASLGNPGASWHPVRTGNFDAKPYSDILWQNTSGEIDLWLMNGFTAVGSGSLGNPGQSWHAIGPS
jgi:hypothetical protein